MVKDSVHIPVLKKEVLKYLKPVANENFIDCTIDGGGYALNILEMTQPKGKLLGIDRDEEMIRYLESKIQNSKFKDRLIPVCDNFVNLKKIIKKKKFGNISGILFDLGMSSWHLEKSGRGFSFLRDEPLDMRYNPNTQEIRAADIVNQLRESEIEKILKEYGEERFAGRIAREIVKTRKVKRIITSSDLAEVIGRVVPKWYQHRRVHFATKTFQALRIAVNTELDNLKQVLPVVLEVLNLKGRIVVISFHSLEDRIVKIFFREHKCYREPGGAMSLDSLEVGRLSSKKEVPCLQILTKKPFTPEAEEIKINPRSRSAKLRAAIKI